MFEPLSNLELSFASFRWKSTIKSFHFLVLFVFLTIDGRHFLHFFR